MVEDSLKRHEHITEKCHKGLISPNDDKAELRQDNTRLQKQYI